MVPFYERIQDKERLQTKVTREEELKKIEILQKKAAYVDGHCILNTRRLEDIARVDEKKAIREADERYKIYEAALINKQNKNRHQEQIANQQNLTEVVRKAIETSPARMLQKRRAE